jgi:hypothetical protein
MRKRLARAMAAGLALLIATSLTTMQASAVNAAPNRPDHPDGRAGSVAPLRLPATRHHPDRAAVKPVAPMLRSDCATIKARLPRLAKNGRKRASCTIVSAANPSTRAKARARASAGGVAAGPVWCDTLDANTWWLTRTSMCITGTQIHYEVLDVETGEVLGTADFLVSQSMQLETTSLTWTENAYIEAVDVSAAAVGVEVGLTASCSSACAASSSLSTPEPILTGETLPAEITYTDAPGGQDTTSATYTLETVQPGTIPIEPIVSWPGPSDYPIRCDTLVGRSPGCVIPAVTPTFFVSVAQSGASAIMIAFAQAYLPDSWGNAQPLRRLADDALASTNRGIICAGFVPDPTVPGGDSCDEFPFAKTWESGAMLGQTGADCAEIKPYIDDVTGTWYIQLVNNVTYTERCVRGHVTLADNTDVGGDLGRFTQQERLLDLDPYWLTVTD